MENNTEMNSVLLELENIYNSSKKLIEKLLSLNKNKNIDPPKMEMVKTFEEACKFDGKNPLMILPYPNPQSRDEIHLNGVMKLIIIFRVLNGQNWVPEYKNKNQPKWYIYMIWDETLSAFRFDIAYNVYEIAFTGTGVRQTGKTKEICEYIGLTFPGIINEVINY